MLYPPHIRRCIHIKTNGVQCGSPAVKGHPKCHFHLNATAMHLYQFGEIEKHSPLTLPLLEDAESIQIALQRVTFWLLNGKIDARTAGRHGCRPPLRPAEDGARPVGGPLVGPRRPGA